MKIRKIVGGLIALIMGGLILIQTILLTDSLDAGGNFLIAWVINLALSSLIIIGGLLGIASKKGGSISLGIGIISIIMAVISTMSFELMFMLMQFSYVGMSLGIGPIWVIPLEPIFTVFAGIIILVSPSK